MSATITIALDAMGGDRAPQIVIKGAALAYRKMGNGLRFLVFGDEQQIIPLIKQESGLESVCEVVHTTQVVKNEDKPAQVIRSGRESSMFKAIQSVAEKKADCIVSAGNTGALMVLSRLLLKALPGVDRPAIAAIMPSEKNDVVVLDLGANVEANENNLLQFAILGSLYAQTVLNVSNPSVGLLNVGEEQQKGRESVKKAGQLLMQSTLPGYYHGFVEGDDIAKGTVDVVVTDGFTGNILLKAIEGAAKLITNIMKASFSSSLLAKIGVVFAAPALKKTKKRVDPRRYNGAIFLGLAGVAVKSHGGTDEYGFYRAICSAATMIKKNFNEHVSEEMRKLHEKSEVESSLHEGTSQKEAVL